jgi:hypothetical protein
MKMGYIIAAAAMTAAPLLLSGVIKELHFYTNKSTFTRDN